MLTNLDSPAPTARLWSRRRILLVFLAPLVVLALVFFFYDEGLEPAPDLVPHWTGSGLVSGDNGLERLRAAWEPLPEVEHRVLSRWYDTQRQKYIWDDALVDLLNPTGRDLRQDLTDALAAQEWLDELPEVRHLQEGPYLPEACFEAITVSAIQKARAGDRAKLISLIRDFRQLAARQFKGSWSLSTLNDGTRRTWRAADLTCNMVEEGCSETELMTLASIWAADDLEAKDLANPLAGHARFCAAVFHGEEGKEFRFGYSDWDRITRSTTSGKIWQKWYELATQPNATMNTMHRVLRSVKDRGLKVSPDRASSIYAQLLKERPRGGRGWSSIAHPNAGGILFLDNFISSTAVNVDSIGRLHLFRVRAMRIWLALRHWAIAHDGKLPAALDELVPGYLKEIFSDPWDGSALGWDPAGRMIYGVGTDWIADVPVPGADSREWLITQGDGAIEFSKVGLRHDRPPPAKPAVPYPEPRAAPVKKRGQ